MFVFRHAETTDNSNEVFSGWRDPDLTSKGVSQAQEVAEQLKKEKIDGAFTSHLKRARRTLEIVLENHPNVPVFVDDRLIERCYGVLQGTSKATLAAEKPEWFAKIHRGYDFSPPEGESLEMVEKRTLPFVSQLKDWLTQHPSNVAISCHNNSMRPIRWVFENLSLTQMLHLENPQDHAMEYKLQVHPLKADEEKEQTFKPSWQNITVPLSVKLASDPKNPLKKYY
ncbi:MAG: histidine phosphatase family protein [Candidatus Bathyarchaeota archaeon]|nr:histidine phosphatase family protein [Candidatus Bathyarchaeota archaeon]